MKHRRKHVLQPLQLYGDQAKVELISTFTTAVSESWNVSDKYTWDNARDLKQLSLDQTLSEERLRGSWWKFTW